METGEECELKEGEVDGMKFESDWRIVTQMQAARINAFAGLGGRRKKKTEVLVLVAYSIWNSILRCLLVLW